MSQKSFFQTKAGGLTLAFLVLMVAFLVIVFGIYLEINVMCVAGFFMMLLGMLYAPVKVYVIDKLK